MSVLESAIGWLAPPQCVVCEAEGEALCMGCATSEIIASGQHCFICNAYSPTSQTCQKCRLNSPRHVWISTNYSGAATELVKIYKFGHLRAAADSLVSIMCQTLDDFIGLREAQKLNYLIVPIPTATSRFRRRGFGHSELMARQIARRLGLHQVNALGRLGQSRQVGAKRAERLKLPESKYFIRREALVANQNILLIDDVVTTGSTIREATKILRRAGARRIDALVFAKKL